MARFWIRLPLRLTFRSQRGTQGCFLSTISPLNPIEQAASLVWDDLPENETSKNVLLQLLQQAKTNHDLLIERSTESSLGAAGGRELQDLVQIVETYDEINRIGSELEELKELLDDPELSSIAEGETTELISQRMKLGTNLVIALLKQNNKKTANDESGGKKVVNEGAIIEVRAGTGGDEAGLFAKELFDMYSKYARGQGWTVEEISTSENEIGGLKEGMLGIKGDTAYERLMWESGVHRVQRVPVNDVKLQTSAATVAVLADNKMEGVNPEMVIPPQDLRIDYYRSSGPGGQHVNTTDSAVRITHIPTNTVVAIQDGRSQHQNKAKALLIIVARINDAARIEQEKERSATIKSLTGSGDRSERIRTYNFPQDRITDHRLKEGGTINGVEKFMTADSGGDALGELLDKLEELQLTYKLENLLEPQDDIEQGGDGGKGKKQKKSKPPHQK